ncbi:uncharacterized protein BBOV_IV008690 [Babesia bovis T2Bo]|uniref:Sac domain-containing inositol phosphatase 3, putative n=1 Tax=Babesia bovis TaxID=5865 RepID=A7ARQ4_BABBO|nr:uncharacterized protein BBOV_IV008690 [Babesia bovis T2Bo]EDO07223.1 hypothetical protein BBOV_IV008690 [Babesia bovis T2Bo]|eukprot:XP_001610791.1 Sac domain-containing inositol phosphatase 3 [Babesia bovis T2Bo]
MLSCGAIQHGYVYDANDSVIVFEPRRRIVRFTKNVYKCEIELLGNNTDIDSNNLDSYSGIGKLICECYGVFGVVQFLQGAYLVVITGADLCGCINYEHDVYTIRSKKLVPLFNGSESTNRLEQYYCNMFMQFDVSTNFYFSYSYNLCNNLQSNYAYLSCSKADSPWLHMDPGVVTQKFRYNYIHAEKFGLIFTKELEYLCLRVIHGYYGQTTINLSGRLINGYVIARRSRFYAGTRYRKRGITASGHVANDVETEQILEDKECTGSIYSFVQVRGSTPVFWAQEITKTTVKKPPLTYPQCDPAYTAQRKHVSELVALYGVPLIMLNLLSDDKESDEGLLSSKYKSVIDELNRELPEMVRILYLHKDIRGALETGNVSQMISELIEHVYKEVGQFHLRYDSIHSVQSGVLRTSCLDCLDRTSVVTMQLGLHVFQTQLASIGVQIHNGERQDTSLALRNEEIDLTPSNDVFHFNQSLEPLLELFKAMFESMGDALAMQYAGSRAIRKYQGVTGALSRSLQLITTLRRRYSSHFTDADRQNLSNLFLGVLNPDKHPPPWYIDADKYISHERFSCEFDNLDWWVLPLITHLKRIMKLKHIYRPWVQLFDENGEYKLWVAMAKLIVANQTSRCIGIYANECCYTTDEEDCSDIVNVVMHPEFSIKKGALLPSHHKGYVEFSRYMASKTVHISRIDTGDTPSSGRTPNYGMHLESSNIVDHCYINTDSINNIRKSFHYRQPDMEHYLASVEPWRIKVQHSVFAKAPFIKSNEVDRNAYNKFVNL